MRSAARTFCLQFRSLSGSSALKTELPYPDQLSKALSPIGYMKWKMNVIDNARNNYEMCSNQFQKLNLKSLPPTFDYWFSMTILHVYILQKRLNLGGPLGKDLSAEIMNHVWLDVEIKLHQAGVKFKVSKIVKDLVAAYQGQILGYDEGLYFGDAILAGAIWRNLYHSSDVTAVELAKMVEFMRKELHRIEKVDLEEITNSKFKFSDTI